MPASSAQNHTVVENLRTAYEAEAHTSMRYRAFSEKASAEGWKGVASLFRAAARAEQIHAGNHGRILQQLGGSIDVSRESVEVKATSENLKVALTGELYEVNSMYPAFAAHAQDSKDTAVTRSFTWAMQAEKTHARLFAEALAKVEIGDKDSWITAPRSFYICPVCGYTAASADEGACCRVCYCSMKKFEVNR